MIDSKLQTFITVASIGNLTKASRILNITQPAVSQHIKALEEYYETKLLCKEGKRMNLTDEGELLLEYAIRVSRLDSKIKRQIRNSSMKKKKYYVGATLTIGGYVLPKIMQQMKLMFPNIEIIMYVENTETILERLEKGEIDLGLVEGPFNKSKVKYEKYKDDEMMFAVSPKHRYSKKESVSIQEVLSDNLILREEGSGTRKIFENWVISLGHSVEEMNVYMEIGSIVALVSLIEANLGSTIISKEAIKELVKSGRIIEIPIKGHKIIREFNFVYMDKPDDIGKGIMELLGKRSVK